jgi:hypothetical protein
MPGPRSPNAPVFSGRPGDPIANFLHEYEIIATSHSLTDAQKVECTFWYVPYTARNFWTTLNGYDTKDWPAFRKSLEKLYPNFDHTTRYTRQALVNFAHKSSMSHLSDEQDFMEYYLHFLSISNPLLKARQISDEDQSTEFFQGFHQVDWDMLAARLFAMHPRHPPHKPYAFEDIYEVARGYFANT